MESWANTDNTQLSASDRLCLIQTLNALPPIQFDELVAGLAPLDESMLGDMTRQSDRSGVLMEWVESPTGPGVDALEEVLERVIAKYARTAEQLIVFVTGEESQGSIDIQVRAFVEHLRQKTRDPSIDVVFWIDGQARLILSGSPSGLQALQTLFESGDLSDLEFPAYDIYQIGRNAADARKARLIQAVGLRQRLLGDGVDRARVVASTLSLSLERAIGRTLAIKRARAHIIASTLDLARSRAQSLTHDSDRVHESDGDLVLDTARVLALERDLFLAHSDARALTQALTRGLIRSVIIAGISAITIALIILTAGDILVESFSTLAFAGVITIVGTGMLTIALVVAFASARDLTRIRGLVRTLSEAIATVQQTASELTIASDRIVASDLRYANLIGANLRELDLRGTNLRGANLHGADVAGTLFGSNKGLTEADKHDLMRRGAIFQDATGGLPSPPIAQVDADHKPNSKTDSRLASNSGER